MRELCVLIVLLSACGPRRYSHDDAPDGDADGDADGDGDGPACDRDADGFEAVDCGGDDCDDAAAGTHPGSPDATWSVERVLSSGELTSFVIAPDGTRHIVVGQGLAGISYLTDRGGTWAQEVLDPARYQGRQSGLAIDASGAAHVVWVPESTRELRYATNASGAWVQETVDANILVDTPCIGVDAGGVVHVVYSDLSTSELRAATREDATWRTEAPLGMRANGLAMALDADGAVHIAFGNPGFGGGAPTYATNASGPWTTEATGAGYPNGAGSSPSIAIGPDGVAHVAWFVQEEGILRYATNATGAFLEQDVALAGTYGGSPHLAIDAGGRAHIAATQADDWGAAALIHAVLENDVWIVGTIAAGYGGVPQFDADDVASILFTTADFDLGIAHHAFADGVDQDCDGTADRRSGYDPAIATVALGDFDAQALCEWGLELQGGAGAQHTCSDGTITVGAMEDCIATRGMCPTVDAFEQCMLAIAADPCAVTVRLPPACDACTSGVDANKTLAELTAPEWEAWCSWSVSTQGGEGKTTACPDGSVQVRGVADCVSGATMFAHCTVTVAEADACTMAMAEDACTGMVAPACEALVSCMVGG